MGATAKIGSLIGLLAVLAAGCSSQPEIYDASASGDGVALYFSMNECHGEYDVNVDETDDEVSIAIFDRRRRGLFAGGDDCSDRVGPIHLLEPLGDRRLIDTSRNANIPVTYEPWNRTKHTDADYAAAVASAAQCVEELDPEATVEIVTHRDGYPELNVTLPELGDGEDDSGRDMTSVCIERHIEPLRR